MLGVAETLATPGHPRLMLHRAAGRWRQHVATCSPMPQAGPPWDGTVYHPIVARTRVSAVRRLDRVIDDEVSPAYLRRAAEYVELFGSMSAAHPSDRQLVSTWAGEVEGSVIDAGCGPGHAQRSRSSLMRSLRRTGGLWMPSATS